MNSTIKLQEVSLVLDENQLCTLITMARKGLDIVKEGHCRQDTKEVMSILTDALEQLI